ncbi:hypothetical protein DFS34DRAFT_463766 [Phlyctochytrium arcticum]|nr:hypothetical protein DFS34DRAFT_463766 [Phlyctochytrium arcticum]
MSGSDFLQKLQPRIAHSPGYTEPLFSSNGSLLFTVGHDHQLRYCRVDEWLQGDEDDEDNIHIVDPHTGPITCIATLDDLVVTGSEDKSVCSYRPGKSDTKKVLLRSTLPIRHVAIRPGSYDPSRIQWIAIASDELDIKLVDLNDMGNVAILKGHSRGVKTVIFDPTGNTLLSASSDGTLRVWDLTQSLPKCQRILENMISTQDAELGDFCRIAWHPSGSCFATPGKLGTVSVLENKTWRTLYSLKEPQRSDTIVSTAWSSTGTHLLTLSKDGHVAVWKPDTQKKQPILSSRPKNTITGFAWHPTRDIVCLADYLGRVSCVQNPLAVADDARPNPLRASGPEEPMDLADGLQGLFELSAGESDGEDERPAANSRSRARNDELEERNAVDLGAQDDVEDFVVDDDGAGYANALDKPGDIRDYHEAGRKRVHADVQRQYGSARRMTGISPVDSQEAFQSGSTPMLMDRRYLAFNLSGVIYTVDAQTHHNVNVEFHDRSIRPFHFTDYHNYSMAALGEIGACFASVASAETPSTIFYRPFDTWASNASWTVKLKEDETVKALAITNAGPVAATDQRYLRFFSFSGLQTNIVSIPGPIVTMSSNGDLLLVAYHAGGVFQNDQNLGYFIYDIKKQMTLRREALPISPESTLFWIGITSFGMPASYDSAGILRYLLPHRDYSWVPMLDSRPLQKSKKEWYWPVEAMEDKLMCIICKGGNKYPGFPRPIIHDLNLAAPLLEMDADNAADEERLFRLSIMAEHRKKSLEDSHESDIAVRDIDMDKILLKLLLIACKKESVQRALDLCGCLQSIKAIDGAIKIAVMNHLPALAERMNLVKESRLKQQEMEEMDMFNGDRYGSSSSNTMETPSSTWLLGSSQVEQPARSAFVTSFASRMADRSKRTSSSTPKTNAQSAEFERSDDEDENRDDEVQAAQGPVQDTAYSDNVMDEQEDTSETRMSLDPPFEASKPRSVNPFALNSASTAETPAPAAKSHTTKNLFNTIKGVVVPPASKRAESKALADTNSKKNVEAPAKKRKNQTTLFGKPSEHVKAPSIAKRLKSSDAQDDAHSLPLLDTPDETAGGSLANDKENEDGEDGLSAMAEAAAKPSGLGFFKFDRKGKGPAPR